MIACIINNLKAVILSLLKVSRQLYTWNTLFSFLVGLLSLYCVLCASSYLLSYFSHFLHMRIMRTHMRNRLFFMRTYANYISICDIFSNAFMRPFNNSPYYSWKLLLCSACILSFFKFLFVASWLCLLLGTYFLWYMCVCRKFNLSL